MRPVWKKSDEVRVKVKACVLEAVGKLKYKEVAIPDVKAGQVLLKIKVCGICSSDVPRVFQTGTYHFPTIPGHEFAGEIVDVAPDVDRRLLGRRAAVFPLLPCMQCPSCLEEQYARCDSYQYFGSRCDGGFAEYIAVPVWNLVLFSEKVSWETAALCEPAAVALHSAKLGVQGPCVAAVIGTGAIGLMAARWAVLLGAQKVLLIGRNESKRAFIEALGWGLEYVVSSGEMLTEQILALTNGRLPDVTLECVGAPKSISQALDITAKGGRIVLTGNPAGEITLPQKTYWKILRKELRIEGSWNSVYPADWQTVADAMEAKTFVPDKLITHHFPLKSYKEAFQAMRDPAVFSMKVVLEMEEYGSSL